jgi:uncharacterized membrane protein
MENATPDQDFLTPEWFELTLQWIALCIEAVGVGAIVIGGAIALAGFGLDFLGGRSLRGPYHALRRRLARSILLGLEFLIAADIIRTVAVQPSIENLTILGIIVLIRTFLSFSLAVEIEGRWPWQRSRAGEPERTV